MSDTPPRRSRNRMLVITAGSLALGGLVVAGVFAAGDTGPARANLPTPGTSTSAATATAPAAGATPDAAASAAPVLKGTGTPIRVSGTDPVTGKRVSLRQFTGKPVVLAIWASWCPGCNDEAPHLGKVAADRDDVHFVGVNYRDDRAGARAFSAKYGWSFPSIEDASGEISFDLGLQGTPTTILLNSEHREIGRIVGATDAAGFEEAVDRITATQ